MSDDDVAWKEKSEGSISFLGMTIKSKDAPPENPYPFGMKPVQKQQGDILRSKFVSRATLESSDGIFFKEEKEKELTEEDKEKLRRNKDLVKLESRGVGMSLYEQLQKQKEKKEEEYQAKQALYFAPPRALDEEDISHLDSLEAKEREKRKRAREQEENDRAAYRVAMSQRSASEAGEVKSTLDVKIPQAKKKSSTPTLSLLSTRPRVKIIKRKKRLESAGSSPKVKKQKTSVASTKSNESNATTTTTSGLLGGQYSSSSSSSDDDDE
eukprot:g5423.t1